MCLYIVRPVVRNVTSRERSNARKSVARGGKRSEIQTRVRAEREEGEEVVISTSDKVQRLQRPGRLTPGGLKASRKKEEKKMERPPSPPEI